MKACRGCVEKGATVLPEKGKKPAGKNGETQTSACSSSDSSRKRKTGTQGEDRTPPGSKKERGPVNRGEKKYKARGRERAVQRE